MNEYLSDQAETWKLVEWGASKQRGGSGSSAESAQYLSSLVARLPNVVAIGSVQWVLHR